MLLATNRDERLDRAWDVPGRYWPETPDIVAGRDRTAGGTWMGVNRAGVVAAVLNRQGTLGPVAGKRSRGDLPLIALAQSSAEAALGALARLDAGAWRSFNMVIADRSGAYAVRGLGHGRPDSIRLGEGVHMVTAHDPDDFTSPRVARHLPRFRAAAAPTQAGWESWRVILADREGEPGAQINVVPRAGFGTSSSSFLALPSAGPPLWLFAPGPPDEARFEPVLLPA